MSDHPTLTEIPNEVVLDHLLPALQLRDIVSLSAVNRQFNLLTSDPTFWRSKTLSDFTFPTTSHPTTSSSKDWWKRVYLGLLNPKAYLWGSSDNNRLGGAELTSTRKYARYVDIPSEICWNDDDEKKSWSDNLKDSLITGLSTSTSTSTSTQTNNKNDGNERRGKSGVVELQAGGWSFTARTSDGSVWVWGQLDGTRPGFRIQSWEDKHCPCPRPTKIPLPCKVESISAGRRHLVLLDSDNLIWELRSWGKAHFHTAPELTAPIGHGITRSPPHIVQLSTGWQHSAALTSKGEIHVWYPFSEGYENSLSIEPSGNIESSDKDKNRDLKYGKVGENVLVTLPPLPLRPANIRSETDKGGFKSRRRLELQDEWDEYERSRSPKVLEEEQKIVKIASGEDFIVALKKNGEVWLIKVKEGESLLWQYMEYFSSPSITHLTAQFRSFTTYATPTSSSDNSSAVYHARITDYTERLGERIIPDSELLGCLKDKGIIQIAIGDYHYAALNDKGQMFTWGQGDSGQLGRGQDKFGKSPIRVQFPEDEQDKEGEGAFVFSITAGGWHTGALVLGDSKPRPQSAKGKGNEEQKQVTEQEDQREEEEEGGWPRGLYNPFTNTTDTVPVPPNTRGGGPVRAMPMYRIGFAGRGANFGGLAGLGRGRDADAGEDDTSNTDTLAQGNSGRGAAPIFRVGFAGRGANTASGRGRGGGQEQGDSDAPW
ncbi:hypothetical protein V865_008166 [Kwoniella europaea PYCC6329]|uniref:SCF-associated factor 1 n=1 Tax=Kwoniella europaea PYCC6329 TaxID=1423913 RepID=A0AAX4KUI2_9TREE